MYRTDTQVGRCVLVTEKNREEEEQKMKKTKFDFKLAAENQVKPGDF
jgi:hypothetical protein